MAKAKAKREKRQSAARRRAEAHVSGFETTVLRMPENASFFEMAAGTYKVDVVPYKTGKGNPFSDEGDVYYERTYYTYRKIGVEENSYVCPSKTYGKKDFIQEWRTQRAKDPNADPELLKSLLPKERQLFMLLDHAEPEKGIKIWEVSYHLFGKLLDSRIKNSSEEDGWDMFYYPDSDGMSLRLTIEDVNKGSFKFQEVTAIDFMPRKEGLSKEILNNGICLDDLLIEKTYDELKAIFLGADPTTEEASDGDDSGGTETPASSAPAKEKAASPLASDYGIEKGDAVEFEGDAMTVARISKDGTSLLLKDDESGETHKGIGPEQVTLVADEPAAEEESEVAADPDPGEGADPNEEWDF